MKEFEDNNSNNEGSAFDGVGNMGAFCLSLFLLPTFIDFSEDFETLFNTFEAALYLRVFFSWFSIWFTLILGFKGVFMGLFYILKGFEATLARLFNPLFKDPFSLNHEGKAYRLSSHPEHDSDQDEEERSSKPFAKGLKVPFILPKRFLKLFKITVVKLGNWGILNNLSIWKLRISNKLPASGKQKAAHGALSKIKLYNDKNKTTKVSKKGKGGATKAKPAKAAKIAKPAKAAKAEKPAKVASAKGGTGGSKASVKLIKTGKAFFKKASDKVMKNGAKAAAKQEKEAQKAASKQEKTDQKEAKKIEKKHQTAAKKMEKKLLEYSSKAAAKFHAKQQTKALMKSAAKQAHKRDEKLTEAARYKRKR